MITKHKVVYLILTIIAIGLMLAGPERITSIILAQEATKIPVSILLDELQRLPLPDGHTVVTQPRSFDKEVVTGVSIRIKAEYPMVHAISELEQVLARDGWSGPSRRRVAQGEQVKFCKKGMSLVIEPVSQGQTATYYVAVGWTKFKRSPSFCPAT